MFFRFAALLVIAAAVGLTAPTVGTAQSTPGVTAPTKHLVVIFEENKSFDAYFGTYPVAANRPGEPEFVAAPGTPAVNGLDGGMLTNNPNLVDPFRIDRTQAFTCYVNNAYSAEQKAVNRGLLNNFAQSTSFPPFKALQFCPDDGAGHYVTPLGYYDGNTVTALWNYAQRFAMSDNSFGSTFGQSTIGALNLIAGDTSGILCGPFEHVYGIVPVCGAASEKPASSTATPAPAGSDAGTLFADTDPYWDVCSDPSAGKVAASSRRNIGDLLNAAGVTWGWFQGGFAQAPGGGCSTLQHPQLEFDLQNGIDPAMDPNVWPDYIPHHEPFQYFASTANPMQWPPLSLQMVGRNDQANHQYDLSSFWDAATAGNVPAVSFLKPPHYQDGHPGESNPIDEQRFLVETINRLQSLPEWSSMAIVIAWDDSGGFYDHVTGPLLNHSNTSIDVDCGATTDGPPARCGRGPRLPLMVLSPFAKRNYVSHAITDQTSVTRLIEDTWLDGQRLSTISFDNQANTLLDMFDFSSPANRQLLLDPRTGEPVTGR